jgi:hypothetical protein
MTMKIFVVIWILASFGVIAEYHCFTGIHSYPRDRVGIFENHMTMCYQPGRLRCENLTAVISETSTEPYDNLLPTWQTTVSAFNNCYS